MAGKKRTSTTDLNHDNWDQEEEKEEKGVMQVAKEQELKSRKIIQARRKLPPQDKSANPFASLNLFASKPAFSFGMSPPANVSSLFGNLSSNNTPSPVAKAPEELSKVDEEEPEEPTKKRSRSSISEDEIVMEKTLTPIKEVCSSGEEKNSPESSAQQQQQQPCSLVKDTPPQNLQSSFNNPNINHSFSSPTRIEVEAKANESNEKVGIEEEAPAEKIPLVSETLSSEINNGSNVIEDEDGSPEMPPDDDNW